MQTNKLYKKVVVMSYRIKEVQKNVRKDVQKDVQKNKTI